jgi:hypothetical protein
VVWIFLLVAAIVVGILVWLALVLFKWLFILAVIAAIVWLVVLFRRRVAN